MIDIRTTIIPKSNQLNADDLIGTTRTIEISKVSIAIGEQPLAVNYVGDNGKPYLPCKSMRRVLAAVWGIDGNAYVGRFLTLYRDEKVTFGGMAVGGIRISHMSDIKNAITLALTASKSNRKPFTVNPYVPEKSNIETLKETGIAEASKGIDSLKTWWKSIGGASQNLLGEDFLADLKKIAASATISKTETVELSSNPLQLPLIDRVNSMIADLAMDREQEGTEDYKDVANSHELATLLTELKTAGETALIDKLNEAI